MPGFKLASKATAVQKSLFGGSAAPIHKEWNGAGGFKPGNQYGKRAGKKEEFSGDPAVAERVPKAALREQLPKHEVEAGTSLHDPVTPTMAAEYKAIAKTKAGAKAKSKEKPETNPHPSKLEHFMNLGGSTGAVLTKTPGAEGFSLHVVKRGNNEGHIRAESHADRLYEAMGIAVPKHTLHEMEGGPVKVSSHIQGKSLADLKYDNPKLHAKAVKDLQNDFVADALLGNWDVIGKSHDNILVTEKGKAYRIDNGGSLEYRAQGAKKAEHQFGREVGEIDSMRHGGNNPSANEIFGSITDKEVAKQIGGLLKKKDAILAAAPEHLKQKLSDRLDWLGEKRLQIHADLKTKGAQEKLDAKQSAKMAKKADAHQAKIDKFQSENPGKPLPKSLANQIGLTKPESAFKDWGKHADDHTKHDDFVDHGDFHMKEKFQDWAYKLPGLEKDSVKEFTGSGYYAINHHLWGTGLHKDSWNHSIPLSQAINHIESALSKAKLPEPTALYRGVSQSGLSAMGIHDLDSLMPGQLLHMTGFKSTSINPQIADQFSIGGVRLKILADKGTKGAYVNGNGLSSHSSEKEFLLPHSTQKFKIHSVKRLKPDKDPGLGYDPNPGKPSHEIVLSIH